MACHLLLCSLLLLFWWLSSFRDAGAWTKPVISSEFSLQGDYHMCQHAFHSHIIKCFGPFTANYTIANAFFLFFAPTLPPRLMMIFDMSWQLCMHYLPWFTCTGLDYLVITICSIADVLFLLCDYTSAPITRLYATYAPARREKLVQCKYWSERSINA